MYISIYIYYMATRTGCSLVQADYPSSRVNYSCNVCLSVYICKYICICL